ncbi:acyl-ACP--UDP-N-acetylglucosamine O-acyltransferase [Ponticoccus sp. SC2-23]|uniref:acyl-ACP--UDP-N-acetylglucosamine O-acyltransferase n=1 Tax=Alexandriicola marinus TaxID=2081710 RepID=UPI000FDAAFDF|nr:acyl-ACP--UDP-N-acetylglucosamine O-acyltransferase [Alexandriicola marinus]MBM1218914.1 acyl-ACP--UDP-N-acetylglucosamine O-acyltransferase [Ponticoccus sp. SC6-9]MBM1224014.1 acyl-ACP--UDP-N-acetylglucosamine O-acyltransferase [Ponticoccus sp. SC6-15]MBM1230207.1 acyl-ACP--UDP-N-acetylglucosamine O-acyltransferase [Ponticoccus sp. SC6-38]MBM1232980.1 acyl-ACP--UDP-N-acetylglucosamine O-acyltransferase [Ponticoccus sp. SC6-45]MBM1237070.1 acyl-ACP--UDP-N-acetylglucosamine O-acyltransferase
MSGIHPSAVIEDGAEIGPDVTIGPFCHVGGEVVLGAGVSLKSHVVVMGATEIGPGTTIWPFAVIGEVPQDLKYRGEATRLRIGAGTRIREHVTINIGTEGGGGLTEIGDDCLLMAGAHVAHDVRIGNGVILVNHASIAGHCRIGDQVIVGGLAGVHQWVRIGRGAIIGALSMVTHDVIPNGLVQGPRAELDGLNLVGLKRRGVARDEINALRGAFEAIRAGDGSFVDRARALGASSDSDLVAELVAFVTGESDRQFLTPR